MTAGRGGAGRRRPGWGRPGRGLAGPGGRGGAGLGRAGRRHRGAERAAALVGELAAGQFVPGLLVKEQVLLGRLVHADGDHGQTLEVLLLALRLHAVVVFLCPVGMQFAPARNALGHEPSFVMRSPPGAPAPGNRTHRRGRAGVGRRGQLRQGLIRTPGRAVVFPVRGARGRRRGSLARLREPRTTSPALSRRRPWNRGWRSSPSAVHSLKPTWATSRGSTQCTPERGRPRTGAKAGSGPLLGGQRRVQAGQRGRSKPVPTLPA